MGGEGMNQIKKDKNGKPITIFGLPVVKMDVLTCKKCKHFTSYGDSDWGLCDDTVLQEKIRDLQEVKRIPCVRKSFGCIGWEGRENES